MKRALLLLLLLFSCLPVFCQCLAYPGIYYKFEDPNDNCRFFIDTIADTNNIWQIGKPAKTVFSSAFSPTRVIVTDTTLPYPSNDTSSFLAATHPHDGILIAHRSSLFGYYYVNSDTLADYGTIEFSPDNGVTWIDLFRDTTGFADWTYWPKPVLSGNSYGWKQFRCDLHFDQITDTIHWEDTLKYRFSFISDSVETHKDGLMFDNIYFFDFTEGVNQLKIADHISLFPDPASNKLCVKGQMQRSKNIEILNSIGSIVTQYSDPPNNEIDIHHLPPGMYLLHYTDAETNEVHKFTIQR